VGLGDDQGRNSLVDQHAIRFVNDGRIDPAHDHFVV
jgi:hypothetical protein